jgi:hypothetical protein
VVDRGAEKEMAAVTGIGRDNSFHFIILAVEVVFILQLLFDSLSESREINTFLHGSQPEVTSKVGPGLFFYAMEPNPWDLIPRLCLCISNARCS